MLGDAWYTNFELHQTVQIRSKWLRIPELVLLVCFVTAFILYDYLYLLGFLTVVDTYEEVWIGGARRSIASCLESEYNCDYIEPKADRVKDYCATGDENESSGKLPCSTFSQYPPTSVLVNTDSSSKITFGTCVVYPNKTKVYVAGAEHTMAMKFLVLVSDLTGSVSMDLTQTTGYVSFLGEPTPRLLNKGFTNDPGDDSDTELCGGNNFHDPDLVSSLCTLFPPLGVYMSLEALLRAANVSISAVRKRGASIDMSIDFTNMEGFWSFPVGFKPKYTITPRKTAYDANGFSPDEFYWRRLNVVKDGVKEVDDVIVKGVRINLYASSVVGEFLLFDAISKLTLASVVLGFVKMFVSTVLTAIYKRMDSLQHVALLYDVTRSEVSRDDHEIKRMLDKSKGEDGGNAHFHRDRLFNTDVEVNAEDDA